MSEQSTAPARMRSLADDLRNRSVDELAVLIANRSDVLRVIPTDLAELAVELARQQSVRAAVSRLTERELSLLTALCAADGSEYPAIVDGALRNLWDLGLIWGGHSAADLDRIRPVSAVSSLVLSASTAELAPRIVATHLLVPEQLPRAEIVDSEASVHALELVTAMTQLCEFWAREPAPAIQTGELAHRAIGALAAELNIDDDQARRLISIARSSDLVDLDERSKSNYCPTLRYEAWKHCSTGEQWLILLRAWLSESRLVVWDALATLPRGCAASPDSLSEFCESIRPHASADERARFVSGALDEGVFGGVISRGAVSGLGHVLLDRSPDVDTVNALDGQFPEPTDRFIAQADLTLVVPAPPTPTLRLLLIESAELESTGGAHVYRFTPRSIRWALHRHGAQELLESLREHSLTPLPQPLEYLVADTERCMHDEVADHATEANYAPVERVDDAVVAHALARALVATESESTLPAAVAPTAVTRQSTVECTRSLRRAQMASAPVWIEYADDGGSTSRRLTDVVALTGGVLTAFDYSSGRIARFALSRIAGVHIAAGGTNDD